MEEEGYHVRPRQRIMSSDRDGASLETVLVCYPLMRGPGVGHSATPEKLRLGIAFSATNTPSLLHQSNPERASAARKPGPFDSR